MAAEVPDDFLSAIIHDPIEHILLEDVPFTLRVLKHPMARYMPEGSLELSYRDPTAREAVATWEQALTNAVAEADRTGEVDGIRKSLKAIDEAFDAFEIRRGQELGQRIRGAEWRIHHDDQDDPADQIHLPQQDDMERRFDPETDPSLYVPKPVPIKSTGGLGRIALA